jgi:hypothetical protein
MSAATWRYAVFPPALAAVQDWTSYLDKGGTVQS